MAEAKPIQLLLDADARLAAAAGGVARFLADAAGLESEALSRLQSATVSACHESFEHLTADSPKLEVTLTRLADRIEIALIHQGEAAPAVGLHAVAGFAAHAGGSATPVLNGVDRVQFETRGNSVITRLTKFIGPPAPPE